MNAPPQTPSKQPGHNNKCPSKSQHFLSNTQIKKNHAPAIETFRALKQKFLENSQ